MVRVHLITVFLAGTFMVLAIAINWWNNDVSAEVGKGKLGPEAVPEAPLPDPNPDNN